MSLNGTPHENEICVPGYAIIYISSNGDNSLPRKKIVRHVCGRILQYQVQPDKRSPVQLIELVVLVSLEAFVKGLGQVRGRPSRWSALHSGLSSSLLHDIPQRPQGA